MMNVEEALRRLEEKAAMMKFLADSAVSGNAAYVPDARVSSGLGDLCAEVQQCARNVRRSLDMDALDTELGDTDGELEDAEGERKLKRRKRRTSQHASQQRQKRR
jgi:hypothetical protein